MGVSDDEPETVQVNLRLTKTLLDEIDAAWKEAGFNSRSEFLRYAVRDAVIHPEFSRESWKQIAASEHDLRTGKSDFVSREEVLDMLNQDPDEQ